MMLSSLENCFDYFPTRPILTLEFNSCRRNWSKTGNFCTVCANRR